MTLNPKKCKFGRALPLNMLILQILPILRERLATLAALAMEHPQARILHLPTRTKAASQNAVTAITTGITAAPGATRWTEPPHFGSVATSRLTELRIRTFTKGLQDENEPRTGAFPIHESLPVCAMWSTGNGSCGGVYPGSDSPAPLRRSLSANS